MALFLIALVALLVAVTLLVLADTRRQLVGNRVRQAREVAYWALNGTRPEGDLTATSLAELEQQIPWGYSPDFSFVAFDREGNALPDQAPPQGALAPAYEGLSYPELVEAGQRRSFTMAARPGEDYPRAVIFEPVFGPAETVIGGLEIAVRLDDAAIALRHLTIFLAALGGIIAVVGAALAYVLVAVSLKPLDRLKRTAEGIMGGDLSLRADERSGDAEVRSLASALNRIVDRVEANLAEERANQERMRQFLADVSHELRTPLSVLLAYTELLLGKEGESIPAPRQIIETMQAEVERLTRMTRDLVTLARLESGIAMTMAPVDLSGLCQRARDQISAIAGERTIALEAPARAVGQGNADRLVQLLLNLLDNAVVHTGQNGHVAIGLKRDGEHWELTVRDDGEGIPEEDMPNIFDRFHKSDSRTRAAAKGIGLGLPIAKAIAEAHGGTISVTSRAGAGTTFFVRLPVPREALVPGAMAQGR